MCIRDSNNIDDDSRSDPDSSNKEEGGAAAMVYSVISSLIFVALCASVLVGYIYYRKDSHTHTQKVESSVDSSKSVELGLTVVDPFREGRADSIIHVNPLSASSSKKLLVK